MSPGLFSFRVFGQIFNTCYIPQAGRCGFLTNSEYHTRILMNQGTVRRGEVASPMKTRLIMLIWYNTYDVMQSVGAITKPKIHLIIKPTHHTTQILANRFNFQRSLLSTKCAQHRLIRLIFQHPFTCKDTTLHIF